jgi:hypothetical protein
MVSSRRPVKPGYVVTYPNRDKQSSRITRVAVALLLVVSAALMLVVTVGGWSKLAGLEPVNIIWSAAYLVMAYYVMRWARDLLPIAVALGALMLTFTLIAVSGAAGVSWSDRSAADYAPAHALFGGSGLGPSTLTTLTIVIAVTQVLLIIAAARGLGQGWNIEYEVPATHAEDRAVTV